MNFLRFPETKVVLLLALVLGALELGARLFEQHLSKDVQHIRSLPALAARLKSAPQGALKVLIIGNSLSRDGLDQALLKEGLARLTGRPVELAAMYPDASNVTQWFYGYRRYFDQAGARPDLVILGTGRPHLLDGAAEPEKLAAFYASLPDLPRLLREQSGDVEAISGALLARSSALYSHRSRVQPLVFYNVVPGYTETTQTLAVRREPVAEAAQAAAPVQAPVETCRTLADLLATLKAGQVRTLIVAIPMTHPYVLPDCVMAAVQAEKDSATVIPHGAQRQFTADHFPDGYHLDPAGSAEFTRDLLEKIAQTPGALPGKE